jgi:hypothetical protein
LAGVAPCVDLTGGFDSRLLALVLESAGLHFCTNTRSAPLPDDVFIAQEIARRKGWEWHDLSLDENWPLLVAEMLPTALASGDARLEVLQLSRVLHAHQRLALHRRRLLCSAGGEHFERNWESEFVNAGRSSDFNIDRWIDMTALKKGDEALLKADAGLAVRQDFRTRLLDWIEPYTEELNTTKLELLHAYKSTGHGGAYRYADAAFLDTELPFYFKPIFNTAISVNFRFRNSHRLHRHMIGSLDRSVANTRTTHGGKALPNARWRPDRQLAYHAGVARKALNKVTAQTLGVAWLGADHSFPWEQAANGAILSRLRDDAVLDWTQMRIAPVLRRDSLDALVTHSLYPGFSGSSILGRIITAEMALRVTDTSLA